MSRTQDAYTVNVNSVNESLPKIYCCEIKLYDLLKGRDNSVAIISVSCSTISLILSIFEIYYVKEADLFSETSCTLNTPKSMDSAQHNIYIICSVNIVFLAIEFVIQIKFTLCFPFNV